MRPATRWRTSSTSRRSRHVQGWELVRVRLIHVRHLTPSTVQGYVDRVDIMPDEGEQRRVDVIAHHLGCVALVHMCSHL